MNTIPVTNGVILKPALTKPLTTGFNRLTIARGQISMLKIAFIRFHMIIITQMVLNTVRSLVILNIIMVTAQPLSGMTDPIRSQMGIKLNLWNTPQIIPSRIIPGCNGEQVNTPAPIKCQISIPDTRDKISIPVLIR